MEPGKRPRPGDMSARSSCKQEALGAATGLPEGSAVPEPELIPQKAADEQKQTKSFYLCSYHTGMMENI